MSEQKGGGSGPQPDDDDKKLANQTDESAGAIKGPQRDGNHPRERWDIARGAEPSTMGSARKR